MGGWVGAGGKGGGLVGGLVLLSHIVHRRGLHSICSSTQLRRSLAALQRISQMFLKKVRVQNKKRIVNFEKRERELKASPRDQLAALSSLLRRTHRLLSHSGYTVSHNHRSLDLKAERRQRQFRIDTCRWQQTTRRGCVVAVVGAGGSVMHYKRTMCKNNNVAP